MKMSLADIAKRRAVGLIAGGSGLTPMLQVAEEALRQKLPIQVWRGGLRRLVVCRVGEMPM